MGVTSSSSEALLNDTFHSAHVSAHDLNFACVGSACLPSALLFGKRTLFTFVSAHGSSFHRSNREFAPRAFGNFHPTLVPDPRKSNVACDVGEHRFLIALWGRRRIRACLSRSVTPSPLVVRFRCIIGALDSDAQRDTRLRSIVETLVDRQRCANPAIGPFDRAQGHASDVVGVRREAAQRVRRRKASLNSGVSLRQGGAITARIATTEPLADAEALVDRLRQGGVHGKAVIRT